MSERFSFPLSMSFLGLAELRVEGTAAPFDKDASPPDPSHVYHAPTWRKRILKEMKRAKDGTATFERVVFSTLPPEQLDRPFGQRDDAPPESFRWTMWTESRVYFPTVYDGIYDVASVCRYPVDENTAAVGGGGYWHEDDAYEMYDE